MAPIHTTLDRFFGRRGFEEAIVLLLAAAAATLSATFAFGRALSGAWLIAGFDALGTILAITTCFYVWRTGRAIVAGRVWLGLTGVLIITMAYLMGLPVLFWAYPLTVTAFFLFSPVAAGALVITTAALLAGPANQIGDVAAIVGFYGALFAVNLISAVVVTSVHYSRAALTALAERDPLTGIGNRRGLDVSAEAALHRSAAGTPATLLLIDIDRFKTINDTYGHVVGDHILVTLTSIISATVRSSDDVFRYGGEELLVVAHGASAESAARLAEKLRSRIAESSFERGLHITVSIGVAEARLGDTPISWFDRVDDMLYQAKEGGRNRVCVDQA